MAGLLAGLPPELFSPWALALLGLAVGSFLNVVVHRLPLMLERQWWGDVAAQLPDDLPWHDRLTAAEASSVRCPDAGAGRRMRHGEQFAKQPECHAAAE